MVHYGHFNALRQAKKLGDVLVVGVHSDGKPILLTGKRSIVMIEKVYSLSLFLSLFILAELAATSSVACICVLPKVISVCLLGFINGRHETALVTCDF